LPAMHEVLGSFPTTVSKREPIRWILIYIQYILPSVKGKRPQM
jgi:hypothetical protein